MSSLLLLMGLCMFCFPRQLPSPRGTVAAVAARPSPPPKGPQLKDFPRTLRRQLGNDILMFRTASCVLHLLPVAGLYTFLPKYLESQFRLPTHDANLISGTYLAFTFSFLDYLIIMVLPLRDQLQCSKKKCKGLTILLYLTETIKKSSCKFVSGSFKSNQLILNSFNCCIVFIFVCFF